MNIPAHLWLRACALRSAASTDHPNAPQHKRLYAHVKVHARDSSLHMHANCHAKLTSVYS